MQWRRARATGAARPGVPGGALSEIGAAGPVPADVFRVGLGDMAPADVVLPDGITRGLIKRLRPGAHEAGTAR